MRNLIFLLITTSALAQAQNRLLTVSGVVIDEQKNAIPFANIGIYQQRDSSLTMTAVSDEQGKFELRTPGGNYYIKITFLSFTEKMLSNITLSTQNIDLQTITLQTSTSLLDEVIVQGEKSSMELSLDKKIFNVGKDIANAGGTATDILTNIPSVSVDPEGNVKLRGSDNVRILIDGKPSGLVSFKGGSGLQQLQGSLIERVEIITNPSARYEAEGMAGIINIVLKKEKRQGFNGSFELISGYPMNMGGAANLNYRHKKINFFINYSIAYRKQPGRGSLFQEQYRNDSTFILQQSSENTVIGFNNNIRGGLDFYFTEKSILTASYLFRRSDANRITDLRYEDYLFTNSNLQSITTRRQNEDEIEPNSEYSLIYKKSFEGKDHDLIGEIKFLDNWESSDQLFTQNSFSASGTEEAAKALVQKSLNDESEKQLLFQVDYTKPIGKEGKFETGVRSSFRDMVNDYVVSQINATGEFIAFPELDNVFFYDENIHAAYGLLGNKTGKVSYQGGLRAEWTDVKTTLEKTNEVNPRRYANVFPSAHLTFDLPKENDLQVSYSRRVRRPFYNDLSPFVTFSDNRNYFSGNPDLNPEFSNAFEVSHISYFEKGSFSSSLYHRDTKGKIDRIRTVNEDSNSVTITENLKSEKAYGLELTSTLSVIKWWKLDFNFNFFHTDIDGSNIADAYKTSTYSWFTRQTSRFTLPQKLDLQLRANYEAPQKTAQGRRKSLFYTDLAMSKEVLKGKGSLNVSVLDVFNSRISRSVTTGENFYTEGNFQGRRRQVNLTFSYRINQSKPLKPKKGEGEEF